MQINDWIENQFKYNDESDWKKIFQNYFSKNYFNSSRRISELIEKCDSISEYLVDFRKTRDDLAERIKNLLKS